MSRILFGVILLIFSCEKNSVDPIDCAGVLGGDSLEDNCEICDDDPTNDCERGCDGVWGSGTKCECTIETACNYDPTHTNNFGCEYAQGCNEWCEHHDGVAKEFDCNNECGGSAVLDDCGICDTDTDNDCDYEPITIGEQTWTLENLQVTHYNNGDEISEGYNNENLTDETEGAYVVYDNTATNTDTYGNLYNWYAVNDSRGLCPVGWHKPSDAEWMILVDYLGGKDVAGGKMKSTGTIEEGTGLWYSPNTGATNESDFTALPSGYYNGEVFKHLGSDAYFWSSTEDNNYDDQALRWFLYSHSDTLNQDYSMKSSYYSIRCILD